MGREWLEQEISLRRLAVCAICIEDPTAVDLHCKHNAARKCDQCRVDGHFGASVANVTLLEA